MYQNHKLEFVRATFYLCSQLYSLFAQVIFLCMIGAVNDMKRDAERLTELLTMVLISRIMRSIVMVAIPTDILFVLYAEAMQLKEPLYRASSLYPPSRAFHKSNNGSYAIAAEGEHKGLIMCPHAAMIRKVA